MSGPKRARIRLSVRSRLGTALLAARRNRELLNSIPTVSEIEARLKEARRQARFVKAADTADQGVAILKRMDERREALALDLSENAPRLETIQATIQKLDHCLVVAERALQDGTSSEQHLASSLTQLLDSESHARRLTPEAKRQAGRFDRDLRELLLWGNELECRSGTNTRPGTQPAKVESVDALQQRLAHEAEVAQLHDALGELAQEPEGGWENVRRWLKDKSAITAFDKSIAEAKRYLANGDVGKANAAIEQAESQRTTAIDEAIANQQASERTQQIAEAVMQALCDRKYNPPAWGPVSPDDPLSGTRVRADVPVSDGRGNVRVDILLDGSTEIEVENVPIGEEHVCRDLLNGLAQQLSDEGLMLEITDWGRGHKAVVEAQDFEETPRERKRERER
jgi:hypothetical protein